MKMSTLDQSRRSEVLRDTLLALLVTVGLSAVASREGRQLTFDGYHYVEFAKQFAVEYPDRFGNHWPFGWPLAGGFLGRIGIPAFPALVGLSIAGTAVLLAAVSRSLADTSARWCGLMIVASAPVLQPQLAGCLTELPFAAILMVLALQLAQWPSRPAIWGAAACSVVALSLRYAGVITLAMLAMTMVVRWRDLRETGNARTAVLAILAASLVTACLLSLNIAKSGFASGAGRGNPPGLSAFFLELASFGWSAPSALIAGGIRDAVGPESTLGIIIGSACFAAISGLCALAWIRPVSRFSRPCVTVALGYSTGMAFLHCIGEFDALHVARTFLPTLAPLAILAAERSSRWTLAIATSAAMITAGGLIAASRGISREISGDVRSVAATLAGRLRPEDLIVINDEARSLSAYFPNRTYRMNAANWPPHAPHAFVVATGKPRNRDGDGAVLDEDWTRLASRLIEAGSHEIVIRTPSTVLLAERRSTPFPETRGSGRP